MKTENNSTLISIKYITEPQEPYLGLVGIRPPIIYIEIP
mgnify:CR=1 FL=1